MNGRGRAIFLHPIFIFLHRFNAFHAFLRGRLSPFCTDNGLLPFWRNKTRLGWMEIDHSLIVIIDIIARRRGGSVLRCPRMINFKISERWNEFRNGRGGKREFGTRFRVRRFQRSLSRVIFRIFPARGIKLKRNE